MPDTLVTPRLPVSKGAKTLHAHGGHRFLARKVYGMQKIGKITKPVAIGLLCAYCGYLPNEAGQQAHYEALQLVMTGKKMGKRGRPGNQFTQVTKPDV